MDLGSPKDFKEVIEKIVDTRLDNRGITKYISAIVYNVNDDGTVNVYIPPDVNHTISGVVNKSGEKLHEGDSVELCAKNGKTSNSWVAVKHGINSSGDNDFVALYKQDIDLTSGNANTYYPVIWHSNEFVKLEITSDPEPIMEISNRLRATISAGDANIPPCVNIEEFKQDTINDDGIYIYGIYRGFNSKDVAVYLQGGRKYQVRCNVPVKLYMEGHSKDGDVFGLIVNGEEDFTNIIKMWKYEDFGVIVNNIPIALHSYPIGSIYMSTQGTSPALLFGGVWERIQGYFLLAANDSAEDYHAGKTGGAVKKKIEIANLPAHTHGSKTLTGEFRIRRYNSGNTDMIVGQSGIISRKDYTWSGAHGYINAGGANKTDPVIDQVTITATHEHTSVGSGTDFNIMPPFLSVYCWKRVD